MTSKNTCECYSFRRLDPFTGSVQIIRTLAGQARSHDGFDWQIEILTNGPSDSWSTTPLSDEKKIAVKFGRWNPVNGLQQVPANPILDLTQMLRDSKQLVGLLQEYAHQAPFPPADRFELWLLDDDLRLPLALLATSIRTPPPPADRRRAAWRASPETQLDPGALGMLENAVAQRGSSGLLKWFERHGNQTLPEAHTNAESIQTPRSNGLPPPLLLTEQWPDAGIRQLVTAYHRQLAPHLLASQHLTDEQRSALELSAVERPDRVAALWRLYPKIIHQGRIDAARVEARLRSG